MKNKFFILRERDLFPQKFGVHAFHYQCISPSFCAPSEMPKHLSPQFSTSTFFHCVPRLKLGRFLSMFFSESTHWVCALFLFMVHNLLEMRLQLLKRY